MRFLFWVALATGLLGFVSLSAFEIGCRYQRKHGWYPVTFPLTTKIQKGESYTLELRMLDQNGQEIASTPGSFEGGEVATVTKITTDLRHETN